MHLCETDSTSFIQIYGDDSEKVTALTTASDQFSKCHGIWFTSFSWKLCSTNKAIVIVTETNTNQEGNTNDSIKVKILY